MQLSVQLVPSNTQRTKTSNIYKVMKQLLITLAIVLASGTAMMAQTVNDSLTVAADSAVVADVVEESIPEFTTTVDSSFFNSNMTEEFLLPIIIVGISLLTIFAVIYIIFYFRHKTKVAQYNVVSQALAAGKELPEGLFTNREQISNDSLAKGVRNTAFGLGLGIFLWAITGEFGVGCIGFMIMLMGIGQIIIYKMQKVEEAKRGFNNIPHHENRPVPVKREVAEEKIEEKEVEIIVPENEDNNKAE